MNAELEKLLKPENTIRILLKQVKNENNKKLKKSLNMNLAITYNVQIQSSIDSYSISKLLGII